MSTAVHLVIVKNAYDDLQRRTLSVMRCDFDRLIYLASTRDYNSGMYHHEGLAARYGQEQTRDALKASHGDIFCRLVSLSLEALVAELQAYIQVSHEPPDDFIRAWTELEPYRVAVPMEADPTMIELFVSNIRLALEILRFRRKGTPTCPPASSLPPLLGR